MKKQLLRSFIVVGAFAMAAHAEEIKGILMDQMCSGKADLRISGATGLLVGGRIVAEAHTRECLLMPECQKSGYGVYTSDNKFLKFDEAGNRKALAAIKSVEQAGRLRSGSHRRSERRHDQSVELESASMTLKVFR